MNNSITKQLKVNMTASHVEMMLNACTLEDGDPFQKEYNEFVRNTRVLWTALLDGTINDNRDDIIGRLVFHIQTSNENAGKPTHMNTLRLHPAYVQRVEQLEDEGFSSEQAGRVADAEFEDDAKLYGEVAS